MRLPVFCVYSTTEPTGPTVWLYCRLQWLLREKLINTCSFFRIQLSLFCRFCVQVSVIDDRLLKFSKLQELVLSANVISDIPAENLPSTLQVSHKQSCTSLLCSLSADHAKFHQLPPSLWTTEQWFTIESWREDKGYFSHFYITKKIKKLLWHHWFRYAQWYNIAYSFYS